MSVEVLQVGVVCLICSQWLTSVCFQLYPFRLAFGETLKQRGPMFLLLGHWATENLFWLVCVIWGGYFSLGWLSKLPKEGCAKVGTYMGNLVLHFWRAMSFKPLSGGRLEGLS